MACRGGPHFFAGSRLPTCTHHRAEPSGCLLSSGWWCCDAGGRWRREGGTIWDCSFCRSWASFSEVERAFGRKDVEGWSPQASETRPGFGASFYSDKEGFAKWEALSEDGARSAGRQPQMEDTALDPMASPGLFSYLQVPGPEVGGEVEALVGDLPDMYWTRGLPELFSEYFVLDSVQPQDLANFLKPEGTTVNFDGFVGLGLTVPVLGWPWAVMLAQLTLEDLLGGSTY